MKNIFNTLLFNFVLVTLIFAQNDPKAIPQRFDFGKMWTFENPPKEWFKEAYNFDAPDAWFDDVRKSSLRFASWCSASFVSPDGLIMTNHHCSRDVVTALQKEGENFDINGFYAPTLEDERRHKDLFVEQLIQVADISNAVLAEMNKGKDDVQRKLFQDSALAKIVREHKQKVGWEGLRIQTVTYYSGGKFSLYGYKRFSDIRLVLIPEVDLGYFGGDPDNFTYPRYSLDCTFWRAYDDNGKPLNTSAHYFKFNTAGAADGEATFVVGNPGRTERYRTTKQLEYDRDYRYPVQLEMWKNRMDLMRKEHDINPNQDLMNDIFGLSNSHKAVTGIYNGLKNPSLMARKKATEDLIRSKTKIRTEDPWLEIDKMFAGISKYASVNTLCSPGGNKGAAFNLMHMLVQYGTMLNNPADAPKLDKIREDIRATAKKINTDKEKEYLAVLFGELKKFEHPENKFMDKILDKKDPIKVASRLIEKSDVIDEEDLNDLLKKDGKKFANDGDNFLEVARTLVGKFKEAQSVLSAASPKRATMEAKIANSVFNVKGSNLPPDATFTLRISDGVVKGYDYNGTTAPTKTTYFGMYDRYYSFNKKYPWSLPARWENPPVELLHTPMCFVSTNDIIGGNSGSPMINKNKECVGLIFDGNIESLPGNFIYDETDNRTVSVHAGGIVAALRYIYRADRLVNELTGNK